eukprot:jgi/Mesvir1/23311/Mv21007-RA.1
MEKLIKCVDSLSSELENYVLSLPEDYKNIQDEFDVLYNLAACGRALAREKFLPEAFSEILHACAVTSDCAIERVMTKRKNRDDAGDVEELERALVQPLYRALTDQEVRWAELFAEFLETNRVNKGPTLTSATERVFSVFSDFMEDKGFPRYDHANEFRSDKCFWNALFERHGFSCGGGLGMKRTTGFAVNTSRDPVAFGEVCKADLSDFRVFCGKTRLALVANALMRYAGDVVSDELVNEIIDAFDRTGVNNLTTDERYRTAHLHALFLGMVENDVPVPPDVKAWMIDHRARLSEKVYSHNPSFKRPKTGDFFQEQLRWGSWDALRCVEKRARRDEEEEEEEEISTPSRNVTPEKATEFLQLPSVSLDADGWTKMKDFRNAFLGGFLHEEPAAGKGRPTLEDLRSVFGPLGLDFVSNKRRDGVRSDWVKGIRISG